MSRHLAAAVAIICLIHHPLSSEVPAPAPSNELNAENTFLLPGIASYQNGKWVGVDHLLNLSSSIGLVVEVIKPSALDVSISESTLKQEIDFFFKNSGISLRDGMAENQTPLPFMHVLIMLQPIDKGVAGYYTIRLFESVENPRTTLEKGIFWQAITWEKQELFTSSLEDLSKQIKNLNQETSEAFIARYKYYLNLKKQKYTGRD